MKLREMNLQSLLHKLKSFNYVDRVNDTDVTVNVELWPDTDDAAMYILFKQQVGNLVADDILADYVREDITVDELASAIKKVAKEKWVHYLKMWQAQYNALWNVDGTEVRVIETEYGKVLETEYGKVLETEYGKVLETEYGKVLEMEKDSNVTNEQLVDGTSTTEQLTDATSTDYVAPYDSNTFNPTAKNETNAGKLKGTSNAGKTKSTTGGKDTNSESGKDTNSESGKDTNSESGKDTNSESGKDTVTDTFTRGGNIGTVSTVKLITEELALWKSFNFYDFYFKSIADVISIPVWEG